MKNVTRFSLLILVLQCLLGLAPEEAGAQRRKKPKPIPGEQLLVRRIVETLANKDPDSYAALFPDMDTMSKVIMAFSDSSSREFRTAMALQDNATAMLRGDSALRAFHKANFDSMIQHGERVYGLHWPSVLVRRYSLRKNIETRDRRYERLAPERFSGIVFLTDPYGDGNYAFTVTDILLINGAWYGGEINMLLEARDEAEYDLRRKEYLKRMRQGLPELVRGEADSTAAPASDTAANTGRMKKAVVERKFYTGMFDNEIPIQLYIRRLRGGCPDTSNSDGCIFEGMYKFGDQDGYIPLEIQKSADGKWHLSELPEGGEMELTLKGATFTGTWMAEDGVSGYDAKLSEIAPSPKKQERLDRVMDTGVFNE